MAKHIPSAKELANLRPARKGEVRNPKGKVTAGASIKEQINALVQSDRTEAGLRKIASDKSAPVNRRAAALHLLRILEQPDLAQFEPWLTSAQSLEDLKATGVPTDAIKRAKRSPGKFGESREIELHDRSRSALETILHETDGTPRATVDHNVTGQISAIEFVIVGEPPEPKPEG